VPAPHLAELVLAGDRRALSRAITIVESTAAGDRRRAAELLDEVLPSSGGALRVAITGAPGSGKSTFIEALGAHVIEAGRRVAVLAVDPSSERGGGSILGDKVRMESLAREPAAYIRPSPSSGSLGGVARRTREAMLLCEAAGFDVVLVETVGVGQSETAVSRLVDGIVLIGAPAGGDELQGIKRGIMEFADIIVVNKADGDLALAAERSVSDLRRAVHLLRPRHGGWETTVMAASAVEGSGIAEVWQAILDLHRHLTEDGGLTRQRQEQAVGWMWDEVHEELLARARREIGEVGDLVAAVRQGSVAPTSAARQILDRLGPAPSVES
jgi:LAO/AO transport system kinase